MVNSAIVQVEHQVVLMAIFTWTKAHIRINIKWILLPFTPLVLYCSKKNSNLAIYML